MPSARLFLLPAFYLTTILVVAVKRRSWSVTECLGKIGAMVTAGESRSIGRKTCPSATRFALHPTRSSLRPNSDLPLCRDRQVTARTMTWSGTLLLAHIWTSPTYTVDNTIFLNPCNSAIWKQALQFIAGIPRTLYNLISRGCDFIKVCLADFPTPSH